MEGNRNRIGIVNWSGVASVLFFLISFLAQAQTAPHKYWINFDSKCGEISQIRSSSYLSPKTIEKRINWSIGFDERDLPVCDNKIAEVLAIGGCRIHNRSRWFNAVTVSIDDTANEAQIVAAIRALPSVRSVRSVTAYVADHKWTKSEQLSTKGNGLEIGRYGEGWTQLRMIHADYLHEQGFKGQGVTVAQLDAGWVMADRLPVFERMRNEGRLLGTRDFVKPENPNVYSDNAHGTYCLSILAGNLPDSLIGSAPEASLYLLRTEDARSEYWVEEDNWVAAAEFCDSVGVDLISSSLGYTVFDDTTMNHRYEDLDGKTIRISIAAGIAVEKGLVVLNSAGNSGDDAWRYISAPCDGNGVLCVGATASDSIHASFSSYGPRADGAIKPDIVAMGLGTAYAALDSTIRRGNGTSFSCPLVAGATACLIEAFPYCTNQEISDAVITSSNLISQPNDSMGYGIPDFKRAFDKLQLIQMRRIAERPVIFPNPAQGIFKISFGTEDARPFKITLYDRTGRLVYGESEILPTDKIRVMERTVNPGALVAGYYWVRIEGVNQRWTLPLVVIP